MCSTLKYFHAKSDLMRRQIYSIYSFDKLHIRPVFPKESHVYNVIRPVSLQSMLQANETKTKHFFFHLVYAFCYSIINLIISLKIYHICIP
jgi:hypothetical protein